MLVLLALLVQASPLQLEPPEGSSIADIQTAMKALERRCAAYGYTGVSILIENGMIVAKCQSGVTPEMAAAIERLAGIAGKKYELRCKKLLTAAERDQFTGPDKSPPGGKWFSLVELLDGNYASATNVALKDAATVEKKDLRLVKKRNVDLGLDEWFLEAQKPAGQRLFEERMKPVEGFSDEAVYLIVDAFAFDNTGLLSWMSLAPKAPQAWVYGPLDKLMWISIQHPMPFPLKAKDAK